MTEDVKILEKNKQLFALKALNFFSSRSFSFIIFAKGKGSINPFFRLLNSPGKSVEMP
jgi:hypothetical protein